MKLRYRPGGLRPPDPLRGGGVIAFKWPDRPPPRKKILATPLNTCLKRGVNFGKAGTYEKFPDLYLLKDI